MLLADRYSLLSPVGRGGMGQVWEARDERLGRTVAVKLLSLELVAPGEEADARVRRFTREAAVTAGLAHPGVPAIYDAGEYDNGMYLVMELIDGYAISDLIAEHGPLPVPWVAVVGAQIAAVLDAAHGRGVTHRDIKPQNVMLTHDGAVKVLDFGLAGLAQRSTAHRITATGMAIGTLAYMAPEQISNMPATPRTDLYALGCLLYEMLAGGPVFAATSPAALMRMHLEEAPAPLTRADLGPLQPLLWQLLEKDPARRPASAREAYDRLLPCVQDAEPIGDVAPARNGSHLYEQVITRMTASQASLPPGQSPLPPAAAFPRPSPMAPMTPRPAPAPAPQGEPARRPGAIWQLRHSLWLLPTFFFGFGTWLSFAYVGVRHQRRPWLIASGVYLALPVAGFAMFASGPITANFTGLDVAGMLLWLVPWPVGIIHALWVNASTRLPLLSQEHVHM